MKPRITRSQQRIRRRNYAFVNVKIRGRSRPMKMSMFTAAFGPALNPSVYTPQCTSSSTIPSSSNAQTMIPTNNDLQQELTQNYENARRQLTDEWRSIEPKLLKIAIQSFEPAIKKCCICLDDFNDILRCNDCSLPSYYCKSCWAYTHKRLWDHMPDIFKNGMFVKYAVGTQLLMERQDGHECLSQYVKNLVVVDHKGYQHKVDFCFCKCETESETLLRHNLWGCSIKSPKVAVSISLLELFRVLQLEQQISVIGFCNALNLRYSKTPGYKPQIQHLHQVLLKEVLESYRFFVYQLQHALVMQCTEMDGGNTCPACYELCTDGKLYCIDANFGLVRRAAAGVESYPAHHQQLFLNQANVDEFVSASDSHNKESFTSCSNFQAGDEVRSREKNKKLDVKGVIGVCCKHEFPVMFVNLRHGERLAYSIWLIRKLLETNPKMKIFYDIACKLKTRLQNKGEQSILQRVEFAVPVFHGYAHNMHCQLEFSPRNQSGFGLTEGEAMERLWSYLRRFHKITKEMKPEHRDDVLTSALLHYGAKLKLKLGSTFTKRLERAVAVRDEGEESRKALEIIACSNGNSEKVRTLDEDAFVANDDNADLAHNTNLCWEENYARQLHLFYMEKNAFESTSISQSQKIEKAGLISKLNEILKRIERDNEVNARWTASDTKFIRFRNSAVSKIRRRLFTQAEKENVERMFFSTLIKKYPMGQAISNRLLKRQKKVTKNIRKIMAKYNDWQAIQGDSTLPCKLQWNDILRGESSTHASLSAQQKLKDVQSMIDRSSEEIESIKLEMQSTLSFYQYQIDCLHKLRSQCPASYKSYLKTCSFNMETQLRHLHRHFNAHILQFSLNCPVLEEVENSSFHYGNDDCTDYESEADHSSEDSENDDEN